MNIRWQPRTSRTCASVAAKPSEQPLGVQSSSSKLFGAQHQPQHTHHTRNTTMSSSKTTKTSQAVSEATPAAPEENLPTVASPQVTPEELAAPYQGQAKRIEIIATGSAAGTVRVDW